MSDTYGDDFDPINALAMINGARERYVAADKASHDAELERQEALKQLNEAQKQFDKVAAYLRSHAPFESYWGSPAGRVGKP